MSKKPWEIAADEADNSKKPWEIASENVKSSEVDSVGKQLPSDSQSSDGTSQSQTEPPQGYSWGEQEEVTLATPSKKEIIYEKEISQNEFLNKAKKVQELREVPRILPSGEESTVLMSSANIDGKDVAFPTLFPKNKNLYSTDPKDWIELDGIAAYDEAKKRGEVIEFDTQQEADEFARGSWKSDDSYKPEGSLHTVDGRTVSRKAMKDNLFNRDFINKLQEGSIEIDIQNDPELGELARRQVESDGEWQDKLDYLESGAYRLATGVIGAESYLADVIEEVTGLPASSGNINVAASRAAAQNLAKRSEEALEKTRQYEEGFYNSVANGNFLDAANIGVNSTVESAPLMAVAAASGGVGSGGTILSSILIPSEYAFQDISEDERIKQLSRGKKQLRAFLYGGAEGFGEAISGRIASNNFNLFKDGLKSQVKKAAAQGGEVAAKEVAEGMAKKSALDIAKAYGLNIAEEGTSEMVTQLSQDLTDEMLGVHNLSLKEYLENMREAGSIGAFMGGTMGGIGVTGSSLKLLRNNNSVEKIINKVETEEKSGGITQEESEAIKDNVITKKEAVDKTDPSLPEEEQVRIANLIEEKTNLEKEIEGLDENQPSVQEKKLRIDKINGEISTPLEQAEDEWTTQREEVQEETNEELEQQKIVKGDSESLSPEITLSDMKEGEEKKVGKSNYEVNINGVDFVVRKNPEVSGKMKWEIYPKNELLREKLNKEGIDELWGTKAEAIRVLKLQSKKPIEDALQQVQREAEESVLRNQRMDEASPQVEQETKDNTKQEDAKKIKDAASELSKKIRSLKFAKTTSDLKNLQSSGLFQAAWDGALETVATTIDATGSIAQAVNDAVEYLKTTEWYKGLSEEGKKKSLTQAKRGITRDLKEAATPDLLSQDIKTDKDAKNELVQYASRQMKKAKVGGATRGAVAKFMRGVRDVTPKNFVELSEKIDKLIEENSQADKEFNKKRQRAWKNLISLGKYRGLFEPIVKIGPDAILDSDKESYNEIIDKLSKRGLKLSEVKGYINDIASITNNANKAQISDIQEEIDAVEAEENGATKEDKSKKAEEDRQKLIDTILTNLTDAPTTNDWMSDRELDVVDALSNINEEDLQPLSKSKLSIINKGLTAVLDGYVNHSAEVAAQYIRASKNARKIYDQSKDIDKVGIWSKIFGAGAKSLRFQNLYQNRERRLKNLARGASTGTIDSQLGMKGTAIEDSLAEFELSNAMYESEVNMALDVLDKAIRKINGRKNRIKADINAMLYMLQKHYLSNQESGVAHSVNDIVDTMRNDKVKVRYESKYGEEAYNYILSQVDRFSKDGEFNIDEFEKSLSSGEKGLIKAVENINKSLEDKAFYAKAIGRGENIEMLKDYVHYPVLVEAMSESKSYDPVANLLEGGSIERSTKAKNLDARTTGAKPMNISVIESVNRSAKNILMDYYLTPSYKQERSTMHTLERLTENDGTDAVEFSTVLSDASRSRRNILLESSMRAAKRNPILDYIQAASYKYLLGTVRRAFAETISNLSYVTIKNVMSGKTPMKGVYEANAGKTSEYLDKIVDKFGATQKDRLLSGSKLAGFGDVISMDSDNARFTPRSRAGKKIVSDWLKNNKVIKAVSDFQGGLIKKPDNTLSRTIWLNELKDSYKKNTGEDIDLEKAANDKQYQKENRAEIKSAIRDADKELKVGFSTANKAGRSLAQLEAAQSGDLLSRIKYFMSSFLINEYEQVTKALANNKNGDAAKVVAPVFARMISYGVIMEMMHSAYAYTMLQAASMFGDEDDTDKYGDLWDVVTKDFDKNMKKNTAQAIITTMMLRNVSGEYRMATGALIESINQIYGEELGLREGEYNKYNDAIMFNRFTADMKAEDVIYALAPEFQPMTSGVIDMTRALATEEGRSALMKGEGVLEELTPKEEKKRYKTIKAALTMLAAMNMIPRDARDFYSYYNNRHLFLKDKINEDPKEIYESASKRYGRLRKSNN